MDSYSFSIMFDQWLKIFSQLVLVRIALMICDIQLRSWEYLYMDLPEMHWYLEPLHDSILFLNQFKRQVEDHNTYLSWILGIDPDFLKADPL